MRTLPLAVFLLLLPLPARGGDNAEATAAFKRGMGFLEKGAPDKALAEFAEAIRIDPKYALAYQKRGNAYYDLGRYDNAVAEYTEAVRLDPKLAAAYFMRG